MFGSEANQSSIHSSPPSNGRAMVEHNPPQSYSGFSVFDLPGTPSLWRLKMLAEYFAQTQMVAGAGAGREIDLIAIKTKQHRRLLQESALSVPSSRPPECAERVHECAQEPRAPGGGRGHAGRCGGPTLHSNRLSSAGAWPSTPHPGGAFGRGGELSHCSQTQRPPTAGDLFTLAAGRPALRRSPSTCPAPPPSRPPSVV